MGSEVIVGRTASASRKKTYAFFLSIIVLALILNPATIQMTYDSIYPEYDCSILIKGNSADWHNGILTVEYEDGFQEQWIIDGFENLTWYEETHPLYGCISFARTNRTFRSSTECRVEYVCNGLNIIIGPVTVQSGSSTLIYPEYLDDFSNDGYSIQWLSSNPRQ